MGVRPQVWRRIQVQETVTLTQLHSVLQAVMGWEGDHLHQFSLSEDENITLAELFGDDGFTFSYLYDFGDRWQHEVTVEKRLASESGKRYPVLWWASPLPTRGLRRGLGLCSSAEGAEELPPSRV